MLPAIIKSHCLLYLYVFALPSAAKARSLQTPDNALQQRQTPAPAPLVDFQVSQPILTPSGTSDQYGCIHTQTLMDHVFSNSYGAPFVGRPFSSKSPDEARLTGSRGIYTPTLRLQ